MPKNPTALPTRLSLVAFELRKGANLIEITNDRMEEVYDNCMAAADLLDEAREALDGKSDT